MKGTLKDGCEDGDQRVLGAWGVGGGTACLWGGSADVSTLRPSNAQHLHRLVAGVAFPGKSLLLHMGCIVDRGGRFTWGMR